MLFNKTEVLKMMNLDSAQITKALQNMGYHEDTVEEATFMGINASCDFVYMCSNSEEDDIKVFVNVGKTGNLVAEY